MRKTYREEGIVHVRYHRYYRWESHKKVSFIFLEAVPLTLYLGRWQQCYWIWQWVGCSENR